MAKLNRLTAKIFGETASTTNTPKEIGQFGSAKAGTYNATADVATIQSLPAWSNGWIDAVTPTDQFPPLPEMTGVHKVLSYQNAYLLQQGIPEWDSATTYYTNGFCSKAGKIYISQSDNNLNNDPETDTVNWKVFESGGARNIGEIVASTIPLTDAELHLLDGALIDGSGIYSDFVDYIADLYEQDPTANYFAQARTASETSWTQPTLTQNGTMGGSDFACSASSYTNVYRAFNSTNTQNVGAGFTDPTQTITFYNPNPLKVTSIVWNVYDGNRNPINYTVQGSNDGSNYTDIITNQTSVAGSSTTMDMSGNTNFYKYYKIIVHTFNTNVGNLKTLIVSATQLVGDVKTAEEVWQETVATYGVCGKFVYDSVNNTVRLPKYSNKIYTKDISSTAPVVGNGMAVGLTDGTNNYGLGVTSGQTTALDGWQGSYGSAIGNAVVTPINAQNKTIGVTSDPVYSGIIAQLSDITTSLDGYYYIVIATTTKTDIQVDIDQIATDLNGKADTDLINTTNQAKILMSGMGMPSNKYINLTLGASGTTYTAPANGWFCFYTIKSTAGYTFLQNTTNNFCTESRTTINSSGCGCYIPVIKGDIVRCNYDGVNNNPFWRFYYAQGSESEAQ